MRIELKAHTVNKGRAAKIALLDAIIWLWFHQISYTSTFSESFLAEQVLVLPSTVLSFAFTVGIIRARWDIVPRAMRVGAAVGTSAVLLAITVLPDSFPGEEVWSTVFVLALAIGCVFAAILRMETLAKCDDFATLSVALSGSLMLFYVLSLVLLVLPAEVYTACLVCAPLTLVFGVNHPAPSVQRKGPLPRRIRLSLPSGLPCAVGGLCGFIVALGTVFMATTPGQVFEHPSPLFLIAQMLFILLSIITVFGLDLYKAVYFAVANLFWAFGTLAGGIVHNQVTFLTDGFLEGISSFACLVAIVLFLAFSGVWASSMGRAVVMSGKDLTQNIARAAGLTPREIEVTMLLLEGRSLRVVQEELFISEGTARTHTKRIYAKLGVHSKQELIDYFKERVSNV